MHVASFQPHASRGLAMFANGARGLEVTAVSPGFARGGLGCSSCQRPPRLGLAGLGDWASDLVTSFHNGAVSVIGAVTGSTAQAEAQRNAVAIAQAQAAADMAQSQALANALPWVAGAIGLVGVGLILSRK